MSEITQSLRKHRPLNITLFQSHMAAKKGKFIGPYQIQDFLEKGSYSKIYLAKSFYTNEHVIIKAINKSILKKELDDLLFITKQIKTLKVLKHRNIITLYEIYESKKYLYLITEYCQEKNLIVKLMHKKRFSEEEAHVIFFQLLDAFTYMHKMNICHRNIRAEHILFDKNNRPKLIGFGNSSFYEKDKKIEGAYGSLCYACPEIINEQPYYPELSDVWSLGVILYLLVCGYLPFCEEEDSKNKIMISEGKIEFPKEMSNKLKDLLRHMLDKNPEKRYNFQKIIKHPWIKPFSESFLSQGINIYKTIFPVDAKILNYIKVYNFDKEKIKNDLINNKYNTGTGLYKQIVRKLLDNKIETISDLFCKEFNDYRDNDKNKYENGDKKYEEFIQKVAEYYNKKENYVNDFIQREDNILERLITLKEKKKEEKKLNVIHEENHINTEDEGENDNDKNSINKNIDTMNNSEQSTLNKFNKNFDKNIVKPNLLKSMIVPKSPNIDLNNTFRMTALRRTNTKTHFNKNTLYDNFLKQNHPEYLKKTLFKSKFGIINENVIEVIKEKDESENEKDEKISKKKELKYSISFDDIEENETLSDENKENNDSDEPIDDEGGAELFERYKEDDNEEMAELKKLYFGNNLKQSIRFIKNSKLKKKSVKYKDDVDKKEKDNKNLEIKKSGNNATGSINKSKEKNKNLNTNLEIIKDEEKDINNNLEKVKLRSKFKKTFKNDLNGKNNIQKKVHFNNDKKVEVGKDIDNNNLSETNFVTKSKEVLPNEKIKNIEGDNRIDKINDFFISNLNNKKISKKNNIPNKKDESTQTNFIDNIIKNNKITRNNINSNNNKNSKVNNDNNQIIINSNEYDNNFDNSDLDKFSINENEPLNIQNNKNKIYLSKNRDEIGQYRKKIALLKIACFALPLILVLLIYYS